MRIAVFDYKIIPTNPIGSCHRRMLAGLCHEHEFVVFAVQFDNPCPEHIRFVRVPAPTRPLALLFLTFHLLAPILYLIDRLRTGRRFDLVQSIESNCTVPADIVYAHFCHRRFLRHHWPAVRTGGLRGFLRWLDHFLHSLVEPFVYGGAKRIVVPSQGLRRELSTEYPVCARKISVLANPVDLERMRRPEDFSRQSFRSAAGFAPQDNVLVFVALGHFERKGLPLVLQAMASPGVPRNVKLHVVGGEPSLIASYRNLVSKMGLERRVAFAGMQKDVRPYFWASDAFVFPSVYEVFPLVALEAAAAGIPMIVSPLNGVEEFVRDGENGVVIERSAEGVARGIERLLSLPTEQRQAMGTLSQRDVRQYSIPAFQAKWRALYDGPSAVRQAHGVAASTG
jgi:glycosyltransferase involved in cell wall biosynthesis